MQDAISGKRAQTRQRLIDAARAAIGERGFEAVSLDEIAARVGMTKGAIYDHFGSKDGVILAVMQQGWKPLPLPDGGAERPVSERVDALAEGVLSQGDETRLRMPLQAAFLLYSLAHPKLQEKTPVKLRENIEFETQRLLAAFSPDELPMAPDRFSILLQAMIPGLMFMRSQAPDVVTDEAVRDIFEGLLGPKSEG